MEKPRRLREKAPISYEISSDSEDELAPSIGGSAFSSPAKNDQDGGVIDLMSPSEEEDELAFVTASGPRTSSAGHSLRERQDLRQSDRALSNADRPRKKHRKLFRATQSLLSQKLQVRPKTQRVEVRNAATKETTRKRNNFLLAHKDIFLPLLPDHNHISKLADQANQQMGDDTAGKEDSLEVPYEVLSQQPLGVKATMKPYQLLGLSFLVYMFRNGASSILGDEMGLGKTLQTLSLIQWLKEHRSTTNTTPRPSLVICPLSVLSSWMSEARKWTPGLKVLRFHGIVAERDRLKRIATGDMDRYGHETSYARQKRQIRQTAQGKPIIELSSGEELDNEPPVDLVVTTYEGFLAEQAWFKKVFFWN